MALVVTLASLELPERITLCRSAENPIQPTKEQKQTAIIDLEENVTTKKEGNQRTTVSLRSSTNYCAHCLCYQKGAWRRGTKWKVSQTLRPLCFSFEHAVMYMDSLYVCGVTSLHTTSTRRLVNSLYICKKTSSLNFPGQRSDTRKETFQAINHVNAGLFSALLLPTSPMFSSSWCGWLWCL